MRETVWCVFQRLPGESCPTLAAVCRDEEVAKAVVRLSRREKREQGEPEGEWSVRAWGVLGESYRELKDIDRISHVLDPMRAGLALPGEQVMEDDAEA